MQRITAVVLIGSASCFLVANERAVGARQGATEGNELALTFSAGGEEVLSMKAPGLGAFTREFEVWRETAEDELRKQLHMA